MVKINSKALNVAIKNITNKAAKYDDRIHIKCLNIENGKLRITDGRVLFVLTLAEDTEDGYYEVIKTTQKETILENISEDRGHPYPDVTPITDEEYLSSYRKTSKDGKTVFINQMHRDHFTAYFALDTGSCLSSFYVGAAFDMESIDCHYKDAKNPTRFTGNNFQFYVMPLVKP